ncbi:MAG: hypothetical protein IKG56_01780 [Clostridia bacterium]|nr:hypothetical protein [Clostridia bacterium]
MSSNKKIVSILIVFTLIITIFIPNIVRAEDGIGRISTKVVTKDELAKESTVYVGEIFMDGLSQMQWLYSNDLTRNITIYNNLRDNLPNPYASLIPTSITEEGTRNSCEF